MGTNDGYTLVLNNQYIGYGLDDTTFETALEQIYNYYKGFSLTPMSFTLAEPDFELRIGDRVQVYDEEEQVTVIGNVSKIVISGNCSMTVTCGGFENVSSHSNFTPTSYSQVQQSKQEAKSDIIGSGTALTEYKYISDNSVKFNGVTYTVEKDADTGLISKVSDSSGNEFEPEISAGITDVALHNAVFWAVAMCRKINSVKIPKPVIELLFDDSLKNTGSGTYTIAPTDNSAEILYAAGINGKCYAAVNYSCIQITDVSSLLLSDFTITFWTKINSNGLSKYPGLRRWCWWVANDALRGFEVSYSSIDGPSENVPSFVVKGGTQAKQTTKRIDDGEWHSVSIVQRGDFIVVTIDNSETISWENCVLTPVGKYMCLSKEDYALNGYISSFRVFDRALDEAVIRQILALK